MLFALFVMVATKMTVQENMLMVMVMVPMIVTMMKLVLMAITSKVRQLGDGQSDPERALSQHRFLDSRHIPHHPSISWKVRFLNTFHFPYDSKPIIIFTYISGILEILMINRTQLSRRTLCHLLCCCHHHWGMNIFITHKYEKKYATINIEVRSWWVDPIPSGPPYQTSGND